MNILMLGRWLPPSRRPVRATREYRFARELARAHRLTLAFITDNNQDAAGAISALRGDFGDLEFGVVPRGWKTLASAVRLAAGESCTLSYFRSEALRTRLVERLRTTPYDLLFVSSSSMIQYALEVDAGIPLAVDFGDVDSEWWMRQSARGSFPSTRFFATEAARLRMAEAAAARRAALRVASSPEAADVVKSFGAEVPTVVIPDGLDVDADVVPPRHSKIPTVVLNTSFADDAEVRNAIEFHRTVMAMVRARIPTARLLIVSKELAATPRLGVRLAGAELAVGVADAGPLLHRGTVAVAPLRTVSGLRRAVLEPMAATLPVVATSAVLQGLALDAGHELLVADDPIDFALKVIRLLEDESLRTTLGARGRSFVRGRYTWSHQATQLAQLIDALGRRARPALPTDGEPVARASL